VSGDIVMLDYTDENLSHVKKHRKLNTFERGRERVKYKLCKRLTLTLTSESVYGSQFFHCKLLQVLMN
jgi:hypothetical protein